MTELVSRQIVRKILAQQRTSPRGSGIEVVFKESMVRLSKRTIRRDIYDAVIRVAEPGDVVFFISDFQSSMHFSWPSRVYRTWLGMASTDATLWHTGVYTKAVKERSGRQVRPYIVHATRDGVSEEHMPPSFFTSVRSESHAVVQSARVEIVRYIGITDQQRETIVDFCHQQLSKPFADLGWRHDLLTYAFGLPGRRQDPRTVSCHGLAYTAYEQAGIAFPHHLEEAPRFNLARYLGHPLGHPVDRINTERLYVRDHHFYRDNRVACILALYEDPESGTFAVRENPGKYSWSPSLQQEYTRRYDLRSPEISPVSTGTPASPAYRPIG